MNRTRRHHRPRRRSARELTAMAARVSGSGAAYGQPSEDAGPDPDANGLPFELAEESTPPMIDDRAGPDPATARESAGEPAPVEPPAEPATDDVLYRAARQATAHGELERALRIYRELLDLNPRHVRARNNLALLLDQQGDHDAALDELDVCARLDPDNCHVLVNRGAVLGTVGRFAEAEEDLRTVLRLEPSNAEAHFNLGLVISRKGLWRDAVPHLRRSIELDSSRAAAYFYLGEALNHVDDLQGALHSYQRAVELRPTNARALYGLGIVLDRLNRPDEAAQMYRRSREIARQ